MSVDETREFIIDCLSHPASAEKQAALAHWLNQSEANRALYAETKRLWDASEHLPATPFDVAAGWQTLFQQISDTSAHVVELKREIVSSTREEAPGVTAPFFKPYGWVAAACIPLVLIAGYLLRPKSTAPVITPSITLQTTTDKTLSLPDGSTIQLRPHTTLSYNPAFTTRHIILTRGEAYFSVSPDEKRTFIVQLASSTIKVLGTSFYVKASDTTAEVVVTEGKISLASATDTIILTSRQKGQVSSTGKLLQPDLTFTNEEATVVAAALSAYYQVNITLADSAFKKKRITANFQQLSASEAQQLLNAVLEQ